MTPSEPQTCRGGVSVGGCGPFLTACSEPEEGGGPHRAPQDTLAAEVADARPVLRVLVPDAASLPAQALLALAVLAGAGAPRAALGCGKGAGSPGVLGRAGAQKTTAAAPEPTLLAGPCPGLLDLRLLPAGGFTELTRAAVGDAVGPTHGARHGVLTPGTDTLPCQAQRPEGTRHVSTGLYRGRGQAGLSGPSWGRTGPQPSGPCSPTHGTVQWRPRAG